MKKLILILSLICLSNLPQDKQEKLDSTLEEIKSCLQFVEKKKEKSNTRKYEYIKDFKTEGWACIEKGINSYIQGFNFQNRLVFRYLSFKRNK